MKYLPKRLLVTGGAGFIGANFIRHALAKKDIEFLVNIDLLTYAGHLQNLDALPHPEKYHFVQGNITDGKLIAQLLREHHIDTLIHFAAESHVDRSINQPAPFIQTNVVGTFHLLEAAREVWLQENQWDSTQCRFHHVSTDEVFGDLRPEDAAFTEQTPYQPHSPYSASKAGSDHLVRAYYHTYGLPITVTNCSNNYGPYQHAEKLIPTIIHSAIQQKIIPIYGDGSNVRDWLYVEDHCDAIWQVITKAHSGETYNVGGECEKTNLEIVHTLCQLLNEIHPQKTPYENQIRFVPDRPGHDFRYAIDISKISRDLGWTPEETLVSGLKKTICFYLK